MAAKNVVSEPRVVCFIGYITDVAFDHVRKSIYQSSSGKSPWRTEWTGETSGRDNIALHVGKIAYDGRSCSIVIGMPTGAVSAMRASRLVGHVSDDAILIGLATSDHIRGLGLRNDDPFAYAIIKDSRVPYCDLTRAVLLVGKGWQRSSVPAERLDALVKEIVETFIFPTLSDEETRAGSSTDGKLAPTEMPDDWMPAAPFIGGSDNPDDFDMSPPNGGGHELPTYG